MDTLRHLQVWVASFWSFGGESASASRCGRGRGNRHGVFPGKNVFCSEEPKNSNQKIICRFSNCYWSLEDWGKNSLMIMSPMSQCSPTPEPSHLPFARHVLYHHQQLWSQDCCWKSAIAPALGSIACHKCMDVFLSCFTILTVSQLPPTMDQYLWRSGFLPMLVQRHEHESSGSLTETRMIWTDFNCNCQYHKYITI